MQITGIRNYTLQPNFTERPRGEKVKEFRDTCNAAFDYLGVQNRSIIIHGSCFPASGPDIGVGSPYSKAAQDLTKEFMMYGFNGVQLGPTGEISSFDISPYASKVFAKNPLFIDFKELTQPEYARILSAKTYDNITDVTAIKGRNYNYANFLEAFENTDIALEEAYTTFKMKLYDGDSRAYELNDEFETFKSKAGDWLVKDGMFKILSKMNGTDDFTKWENKLDADLIMLMERGDTRAMKRYNQIFARSRDKIDKNSFAQFLIDKQIKENKAFRDKNNFTYINDLLVGCSLADVWANREAFLEGYSIGCPNGGKGGGAQVWGLPVLNPKRLFKPDGSLDVAGQFLKEKLDSSLEYCENVRMDHALGVVDPWIYENNSVVLQDGEVKSINGNNISRMPHLDPDGNYRKILEKIILPTMREKGLDPNNAVWEDLVTDTDVYNEIYHGKFNLPGITQLEWARGEQARYENTSLITSHDSDTTRSLPDWCYDKEYLAGYLMADPAKAEEKAKFRHELDVNPLERVKAKFIDLFRSSKNIQMTFTDFFAIDRRYNTPGVKNDINWKLRMSNNYVDSYYKNLESDEPTVPNIPELLSRAVQAKIDLAVAKANDQSPEAAAAERNRLNAEVHPLVEHLQELAEFLKRPEPPQEEIDLIA